MTRARCPHGCPWYRDCPFGCEFLHPIPWVDIRKEQKVALVRRLMDEAMENIRRRVLDGRNEIFS